MDGYYVIRQVNFTIATAFGSQLSAQRGGSAQIDWYTAIALLVNHASVNLQFKPWGWVEILLCGLWNSIFAMKIEMTPVKPLEAADMGQVTQDQQG